MKCWVCRLTWCWGGVRRHEPLAPGQAASLPRLPIMPVVSPRALRDLPGLDPNRDRRPETQAPDLYGGLRADESSNRREATVAGELHG